MNTPRPYYSAWPGIHKTDPIVITDNCLTGWEGLQKSIFHNRCILSAEAGSPEDRPQCVIAIMTCEREKPYLNHTLYSLDKTGVDPIIIRDSEKKGAVPAFKKAVRLLNTLVPNGGSVMLLQDDCWIKPSLIDIARHQDVVLPSSKPYVMSCYRTTPAPTSSDNPGHHDIVTGYPDIGKLIYSTNLVEQYRYNGGVALMINKECLRTISHHELEMNDNGSIPAELGRLSDNGPIQHMQTVENHVYHLGRVSSIPERPHMMVDCLMDDLVASLDAVFEKERKENHAHQYTDGLKDC